MIKESILYIGLSQAIFAAFVLANQKKLSVSDFILVACLLSIAIRFSANIFSDKYLLANYTDFSIGIIPLSFGPFLYLYTKYQIRGNPKFNPIDLLHFIPILLFQLSYFIFFDKQFTLDEERFFLNDHLLGLRISLGLAFFTSVLLYSVFNYQQLSIYKKSLQRSSENADQKFNLRWLNFISLLFILLFTSYFSFGLINALTFSKKFDVLFISNIGLISLLYSVSYYGLVKPRDHTQINLHLPNIPFKAATISTQIDPPKKNGHTALDQTLIEKKTEELNQYMQKEKLYLKPDLSLAELSEKIQLNKKELTYLLNEHLGINFFSYINNYRLKEVLQKLDDPKNKHYTILSIAYDCGFNAKSTFNSIFKQHTGLTPSQYRKNKLKTDIID